MESKENNIFLKGDLIEANTRIAPKIYEHTALYAALYQSIFGSYEDYGFTDRAAIDVEITGLIKTMVTVIDKIFKDPANKYVTYEQYSKPIAKGENPPFQKPSGLSDAEEKAFNYVVKNNWIALYFPLVPKEGKDATGNKVNLIDNDAFNKDKNGNVDPKGNKNYASDFLRGFDRATGLANDLNGRINKDNISGGMMTVKAAAQLLKAKEFKASELYEGYRSQSEGQPFKWNKDKKEYGSGSYYQAFMGQGTNSAVNQMKEKNRMIRRGFFKFLLRSLALGGAALLTVASAGTMLSFGGIALSTIFGTAFAGSGFGSAVAGFMGTLIGGTVTAKFGGAWLGDVGELYGLLKDKNYFMNGIGKYKTTDKGPKGYKLLKEQYYTSLGLKEWFSKGKVTTRKARKYVNKRFFKKYPALKSSQPGHYDYVANQNGSYLRLYNKLRNVVQGVPEQVEGRKMFPGEATAAVRNVINNNETDFEKLVKTSKILEEYKDKIGDVNTDAFRIGMSKTYENAFNDNLFNKAYTKYTPGLNTRLEVPEIKAALEASADGGAKARVDASFAYLNAVKTPTDEINRPHLKLNVNLGVSIKEQITLKKDVMANACSKLCGDLSTAECSTIESIAQKIERMKTLDEASAIETELTGLTRATPSDDFVSVKTYLQKMLDKRKSTSTQTQAQVENKIESGATKPAGTSTVALLIKNLRRNAAGEFETEDDAENIKSIADIRAEIMDSASGFDETQKKNAVDALNEQIKSIERREFLETEAKILPVIEEGRFNAITDLMKYINELKIETINSGDFNTWYTDKISKNSNKAFLDIQIKSKIEAVLLSEANQTVYKDGSAGSLDKIVELINKINTCVRLDDAQKTRIILSMTEGITKAVDTKIYNAKKDFAIKYDMAEFNNLVDLKNSPLKIFFALKTPETETIRKKLDYMASFNTLFGYVNTNINFAGMVAKGNEDEARGFSYVYMFSKENRNSSDNLFSIISSMNTDFSRAKVSDTSKFKIEPPIGGAVRNSIDFIDEMKSKISTLWTSKNYTADEVYAALIVMKNMCVAKFKDHFNKYCSEKVSGRTLDNYMSTAGDRKHFEDSVLKSWTYDENVPGMTVDETKMGIIDLIEYKLKQLTNGETIIHSEGGVDRDTTLSSECKKYGYKKVSDYIKRSAEPTTAANFRQDDKLFC